MTVIQISPAGFVAPYLIGTAMYIKNTYDLSKTKFIGGSAGSWISVYMASDINNYDLMYNFMPDFREQIENLPPLKKWKHIGKFLKTEIPKYIGSTSFVDEKRVLVSVSKLNTYELKNEVTDNYETLDELLQLCYLSSFIPMISDKNIVKYRNNKYIDSTFTKTIKSNVDLLIYPSMWGRKFCLASYYGILDDSSSQYNFEQLFKLGYKDALIHRDYIRQRLNKHQYIELDDIE